MTDNIMKYFLLLFTILFLTTGCSPNEREEAQQEQRQQQLQSQFIQSTSAFDGQLADLLEQYFELKDALVDTDAESAAEQSESLHQFLNDIDPAGLSSETLTIWETYSRSLTDESIRIANEKDIEEQRLYFETLSEAMIDLVKTFRPVRYTVYHQSCPMVRGGSADWLSREEEIANPYHGDRMMRCGEIIERI